MYQQFISNYPYLALQRVRYSCVWNGCFYCRVSWSRVSYLLSWASVNIFIKLELVYLPEGKYWIYPRRVYRLAILMPRDKVCSQLTFWLEVLYSFKGYLMLPKHFRWTVVQSVPRGTPDKFQQFRFYLHVCDSRHFRSIRNFYFFGILFDRK